MSIDNPYRNGFSEQNGACLPTVGATSGNLFRARYLIVAVPLTVLFFYMIGYDTFYPRRHPFHQEDFKEKLLLRRAAGQFHQILLFSHQPD